MKNARPFLLALAPLLIGLSVYYFYWRGEADGLGAAIESVTGQKVTVTGFPYRLNAHMQGLNVERGGAETSARFVAGESEIGSGPFRSGLYVGYMRDVRIDADGGLPNISARISAPEARGSLRVGDLIERMSVRFERAAVEMPLFTAPVPARELELHFRETPNPTPSAGATPPGQAEARIAGIFDLPAARNVRLGLPLVVTASAPLLSLTQWRDGGTVEIRNGDIGIGDAQLAIFDATIAALPDGSLSIAGTVTTDCPATVEALFAGQPAPAEEFRTRRPAKLALGGALAEPSLRRLETASGGRVRNQEPPCPVLRQ